MKTKALLGTKALMYCEDIIFSEAGFCMKVEFCMKYKVALCQDHMLIYKKYQKNDYNTIS